VRAPELSKSSALRGLADARWQSLLVGDTKLFEDVRVALPSHIAETYEAATGDWGGFSELLGRVRTLCERGARVVLEQEIDRANYRSLPDLVRFVDDNLPDLAGLRVSLPPEWDQEALEGLAPWWTAAVHAACRRDVGLEAVGVRPPLASRVPGLRPTAAPPEPEAPAEDVVVYAVGAGYRTISRAVEDALSRLGTLARFVDPARLQLSPEELARHVAESPRDARRMGRAIQGRPRVLVAVGDSGLRPEVLHTVLSLLRSLDADVRVLASVADDSEADALAALESTCVALGAQWGGAPRWELRADAGDSVECVLNLSSWSTRPARGALGATLTLIRPDLASGVRRLWEERLGSPESAAALAPPSVTLGRDVAAWLAALDGDGVALIAGDGWAIPQHLVADAALWIVDGAALGLAAVSTDPLALDATLARAAGIDPSSAPLLGAAHAGRNPYTRPEGVQLGGEAPPERLIGARQAPAVIRRGPLVILGIASTTLQNHAAALLVDGQVIASVQEERLRRRKQCGWHPPGRPGVTVVSDPSLPLERAYPSRAVREVLALGGMRAEDVQVVALNGIPARFLPTYSTSDPGRPPVTIRSGDHVFVPHHLTHAASAWRMSGMEEAFVFTVDGRGERETAAFFEASGGRIHRTFDVLCNADSLIGGVYEYITTILGFGHYGQGSTMGLAPLGEPTFDLTRFLSARSRDDYSIHDQGIMEAFGHLARHRDGELTKAHVDLAASLQQALEETVIRFIEDGLGGRRARNLCLAGGVALNCSMNQRLRAHFGVERVFVQPGAHDAGTALGAALEAHHFVTGESPNSEMTHAYLGRGYDEAEVRGALERHRLPFTRPVDFAGDVASLIADGKVVCWFQGRMELGPRALGARSILADPRRAELKDRINLLKGRQWWRPFGPSILAGHEASWFEAAFHSPFMLFTLPVLPERRADVPAILHVDGTTRPQSVTREDSPVYYAVIERFERLTGVPMVVNTSFNTAHEPIVESPDDAISSFLELGADWLAIGPYLVERAAVREVST
jgi:predicted NodU family carbamoyl transferase